MDLKSIGEFGLISIIKEKFENSMAAGVEGIGDDCAVIPRSETTSYVVTTDMLVEGKHFLKDKITPHDLGYKSLAVNISDVASMGAKPCFVFLSLAIPPTTSMSWCEDFIEGFHKLSKEYNVFLLGGDTTSADEGHITISVTAVGEVKNSNIKRRSAAQMGDIIAVNTTLGDSALALKLMLLGIEVPADLLARHNTPKPQIEAGVWFGGRVAVRAMMDISDGVASDLEHICKLSSCGAVINTDLIPHSETMKQVCNTYNLQPLDFSLSGGEDYGLLLTIDREEFETLREEFKGELYPIGEIKEGSGISYTNSKGVEIVQKTGFRHF